MNKPFEHLVIVTPSDVDDLGHVNNVVYVRYIQEVSAAHWVSRADEVLREKYLWVVLRHEVDYRNPAFLNEEIIGHTWVGEYNGARFDRYVKLTSAKSGKVLTESKTTWCMLDAKTMRPTRITQEVIDMISI
ncbi:acyl-CoA thioesterase [Pseudochryseolinea flava]|uniref:Acyl-CoA thioesterase n=1 Tax=Pseudochryseolinea flava TaxID=2059302 RepID=A0A364Y0T0_9BACT|nr:acyl-CoA thioesterase [Pseudochryseolinea flava]RAW00299.1 acyl-CoA thioesterase [Pseudochryseolinea flava]